MLRPYATYRDLVCLLRRDLHLDLPRLGLLRLRERHGQNAVLVARLDVAGVHGRGQGKAALERAIRPFVAVYPLGALLSDLRSEEHTSELQSRGHLVCRLLLE